jgi:hypothetical protein
LQWCHLALSFDQFFFPWVYVACIHSFVSSFWDYFTQHPQVQHPSKTPYMSDELWMKKPQLCTKANFTLVTYWPGNPSTLITNYLPNYLHKWVSLIGKYVGNVSDYHVCR